MSEIIITNLITAFSTLGAAFIGGHFVYKNNQKKDELKEITKNSYRYLNEIKSFYELENEYIKELQKFNNKKPLAIKKEIRAKVKNKPSMTTNDANKILTHNKYLEFHND